MNVFHVRLPDRLSTIKEKNKIQPKEKKYIYNIGSRNAFFLQMAIFFLRQHFPTVIQTVKSHNV